MWPEVLLKLRFRDSRSGMDPESQVMLILLVHWLPPLWGTVSSSMIVPHTVQIQIETKNKKPKKKTNLIYNSETILVYNGETILTMVSSFLLHYQMSPSTKGSWYVYLLSKVVKLQLSWASKLANPYNFWTYIIAPSFVCAHLPSWCDISNSC